MYILFKCFNLYFGGKFPKKQTRKVSNYIKSSCIISCVKMFQYFHIYTTDA